MIEQLSEQKKMTLKKPGHLLKLIEVLGLLLVVVLLLVVRMLLLRLFVLLPA